MASDHSTSLIDRLVRVPDQDLDPEDPFRSLLLNNPVLPRCRDRSRRSKYYYSPTKDYNWPVDLETVGQLIQDKDEEGIIIIEDIDDQTILALKRSCPDLDLAFLHQHAARLEISQTFFDEISKDFVVKFLTRYAAEPQSSHGVHFDGHCFLSIHERDAVSLESANLAFSFDDQTGSLNGDYRTEIFVKHGTTWHRASTRVSCCVLTPKFHLLLIDAPLRIPSANLRNLSSEHRVPTLPIDPYNRPEWKGFNPYESLSRMFKIFPRREILQLMSPRLPPAARMQVTFHGLLVVSDWHSIISDLERDMRRLQIRATESLEKGTLEALGVSRRRLAAVREAIAGNVTEMLLATGRATSGSLSRRKSQGHITVINNISPGATLHLSGVDSLSNPTGAEDDAEPIDTATLLYKLAQHETRLEALAKTVNEEIQLFIASVSIRDSEVMLADSKIMKQQAARTTLLTTLAVIYLPLQLVTGIFGMNIKEITGDGIPRWWACLAALGGGGALTFLVYLAVKWWQWRRSQREVREREKEKEA